MVVRPQKNTGPNEKPYPRQMMRAFVLVPLAVSGLVALAACSPKVPDSGVGFGDYNAYIKSDTPVPVPQTQVAPPATAFSTDSAAAAIDAATGVPPATVGQPMTAIGVDPATLPPVEGERARGDAPSNIAFENGEVAGATAGLSDEQDFSAVTSRESIQSDKDRLAANRAQYVVIQPQDIPERPDKSGPDIIKYALATTNPVGASLYDRPAFYLVNIKTACNKYTSPDFAQQAFLASGGPTKDPKGLDPDGDGFACYWDPGPFRAALQ
jgi:hypothetical protein